MKRTILLIIYATLLALNGSELYSQIESKGKVDLGWKNGCSQYFYNSNKLSQFQFPANTFFADIDLGFKCKFIKLNQAIYNNFYYKDGTSFNPLDIEFVSTLTFSYKRISVGYQHSCLHPVISDKTDLEYEYRRDSEDRIFIRFEW